MRFSQFSNLISNLTNNLGLSRWVELFEALVGQASAGMRSDVSFYPTAYYMSFYLANAGVPLFSQSIFYQIALLIPIIAIEAYVHKRLLNLNIARAILVSSLANLISTIAGAVLFFLIGVAVAEFIHASGAFPFMPLEIMLTLIPMFFFSVILEGLIGFATLKNSARSKISRSVLIANALTYAMLEVLAMTQLIRGYIEGRG